MEKQDDGLGFFRGLINALGLSAILWGFIGLLFWWWWP